MTGTGVKAGSVRARLRVFEDSISPKVGRPIARGDVDRLRRVENICPAGLSSVELGKKCTPLVANNWEMQRQIEQLKEQLANEKRLRTTEEQAASGSKSHKCVHDLVRGEESSKRISDLQAALRKKDVQIAELQRRITDYEGTVSQKDVHIAELQSRNMDYEGTVSQKDVHIAELQRRMTDCDGTVSMLTAEVETLRSEAANHQILLAEHEQSRSQWGIEFLDRRLDELFSKMRDDVVALGERTSRIEDMTRPQAKFVEESGHNELETIADDLVVHNCLSVPETSRDVLDPSALDAAVGGCTVGGTGHFQDCELEPAARLYRMQNYKENALMT